MKKIVAVLLITIFTLGINKVEADDNLKLYANAAVLIDAGNNRILYGKNENTVMPMASTTKIMTLIIALEYGELSSVVTFSDRAAKEPDVQLNAVKGEQYILEDLLYLMMLKSYNDVAYAVAEHVGSSLKKNEGELPIDAFIRKMNEKALELGCKNTYFITPNGLDKTDENGEHGTTAYELAVIASYAIKNPKFVEICTTKNYTYKEINNRRSGSVTNANRFLEMFPNAIGIKTGFTGKAGYCFVGAIDSDGRRFVSVVLQCGWPPDKNKKWADTKVLMNYARKNYFKKEIFFENEYKEVKILNGIKTDVQTYIPFKESCLLSTDDNVEVIYSLKEYVNAPVGCNTEVGRVYIYINSKLYKTLPVLTTESIKSKDLSYYFKCLLEKFFFL